MIVVTIIFISLIYCCFKWIKNRHSTQVETVYPNATPTDVYSTGLHNYPTNPTLIQTNQNNLGYIDSNTNVSLDRQFSLPTYDEAIKVSTKQETTFV